VANGNETRADLIEVTVSGGFKTRHVFNTTGGILGVLELRGAKNEGYFQGVDGAEIQFKKTSFWKSHYLLEEGGAELGSAKPPRAISRSFDLIYGGEGLAVAPVKGISRSWRLLDSRGDPICEIKPRGAFKRGALIRILSQVDVKLLVFVYCLVTRRWQEESSAA